MEGAGASNQAIVETNAKIKGKGPTKCTFINNSEGITLPKIQVNERSQFIGLGSEKFAYYVSVLAREILGIKFRVGNKCLKC